LKLKKGGCYDCVKKASGVLNEPARTVLTKRNETSGGEKNGGKTGSCSGIWGLNIGPLNGAKYVGPLVRKWRGAEREISSTLKS